MNREFQSLVRSLGQSSERSLVRSLAGRIKFYDHFLIFYLHLDSKQLLIKAISSPRLNIDLGEVDILWECANTEWLAFQPDCEPERLAAIKKLKEFLPETKANDDWTRLLAINNLITLSAGTPELVAERNRLCDKAMKQPNKFTFPAELREATQDKEWFNLPEIIALIFLHGFNEDGKSDPFLKPEWFDPKSEDSKFFLTPPREFFALAAEVLDPKGETELAKWRQT